MNGDATATAGVKKSVSIVDSTNTRRADNAEFAGMPRETINYTADGGTILSRTITDPWLSPPTATRTRVVGRNQRVQGGAEEDLTG